jgi:predicted RNase H-like HicB family nuclease
MKYPVTVKQLIDGKWQARCMASVVGEVVALGDDREAALERMKGEIRYRLEFCP